MSYSEHSYINSFSFQFLKRRFLNPNLNSLSLFFYWIILHLNLWFDPMANFTHCLIFVLLLLSCELLSIEGRSLRKSIGSPKVAFIETMTRNVVLSPRQLPNSRRDLEGYVEAFRPTTPGHSPGVGHSIKN
jgi:hypothetical protein